MRVYELSKKFGLSNKDMLTLLSQLGFTIGSALSAVPSEAVDAVTKEIESKSKGKAARAPKATEPAKATPKEKPKAKIEPKEKPKVKAESKAPQKMQVKPEVSPVVSPEVALAKTEAIVTEKPQPVPPVLAPEKKKTEKPQVAPVPEPEVKPLIDIVLAPFTPADFAQKINKPISEIILALLKQGIVSSKNQLLPEKVVKQLAQLYNLRLIEKKPEVAKEAVAAPSVVASAGNWQERLPIVVVIGHVDHGKTTLLDFIRKTRVAAKEKGGITQHLGAYEVKIKQGGLVFLDTPGHEAFGMMRVRGIKVADIAILVVAADDGVKPQTIEAIAHAKSVGLPIIVALNKVDKATSQQVEVAKRQLAEQDLVPEEWGGSVVFIPISAKLGTGIDDLLDVIVLQSQLMELKANTSVPARGYILESNLEKGRGPVATVICQHGVLKVGDYFVAGSVSGKVNSLVDSYGKSVHQTEPSMPVRVSGFSELPQVGELFEVVTKADFKKGVAPQPAVSLANIMLKKSGTDAINILVKTDNLSSREALLASISKLSAKSPKEFHVIYAAVGDITESDIQLAADTGSLIYSLHVKILPNAMASLQKHTVKIKNFDIIYKLLEDLEATAELSKPVKMVLKKIGEAAVLKVFDIKNLGIVAGAIIKSGRCTRDSRVTVWRNKQKIGEGKIKGLQRERKSVKEVHTGFECAFLVDGFDAWEVDDLVECYLEVAA